jgi:hypothetical protein
MHAKPFADALAEKGYAGDPRNLYPHGDVLGVAVILFALSTILFHRG